MTELNDITQRVRANLEAAMVMSQQAAAVHAEIAELSGVGQSKSRLVRATVDYRGFVTGLTFAPSATDENTESLGDDVMEATQLAIVDVQEKARPIRAALTMDPQKLLAQDDIADKLEQIAQRVFSIGRNDTNAEQKAGL